MDMIATNIEQSKHLVELGIPMESADMFWLITNKTRLHVLTEPLSKYDNWENYPAWSISALLELMPHRLDDGSDLVIENEKPQVDGFDAELNALLKKYEHLPKEELQEPLEFYLGVVRDDLDVVRADKPKWSEEDAYRIRTLIECVISAGSIRFEMRNEYVDWLKSLKQRLGGEK